jgi:hypothetical protein
MLGTRTGAAAVYLDQPGVATEGTSGRWPVSFPMRSTRVGACGIFTRELVINPTRQST